LYSKFENLNEEKKQRILRAAMDEFAASGYDDASTNEIVKNAGIAKGALFHYFKNKKQLFLYLYDYCIRLSLNEFYRKMDMDERDLFAKLQKMLIAKMEILRMYPGFVDFLKAAYFEESKEVKQDLDERNRNVLNDGIAKLFVNIDMSRFALGMDINQVIRTIMWAYEGFSDDLLRKKAKTALDPVDFDRMFKETERYTEFLKSCFYK